MSIWDYNPYKWSYIIDIVLVNGDWAMLFYGCIWQSHIPRWTETLGLSEPLGIVKGSSKVAENQKNWRKFLRLNTVPIGCSSSLMFFLFYSILMDDAVDARNPAPADMANIPLFAGFSTSQVVQDFFH